MQGLWKQEVLQDMQLQFLNIIGYISEPGKVIMFSMEVNKTSGLFRSNA